MKKLLMLALAFVLCACGGGAVTKGSVEYKFSDYNTGAEQFVNVSVELEDGKITKVDIDETYDHNGEKTTKKTLGADYNMKPASPIGKEWNEQIAFLEEALVGTDGTIEIDEAGYPTSEDVKAGCTINLFNISAAVKEAVNNAE